MNCILCEGVSSSFGHWLLILRDGASFSPPCRAGHGALAGEGIPWVPTEQVHTWVSFSAAGAESPSWTWALILEMFSSVCVYKHVPMVWILQPPDPCSRTIICEGTQCPEGLFQRYALTEGALGTREGLGARVALHWSSVKKK